MLHYVAELSVKEVAGQLRLPAGGGQPVRVVATTTRGA